MFFGPYHLLCDHMNIASCGVLHISDRVWLLFRPSITLMVLLYLFYLSTCDMDFVLFLLLFLLIFFCINIFEIVIRCMQILKYFPSWLTLLPTSSFLYLCHAIGRSISRNALCLKVFINFSADSDLMKYIFLSFNFKHSLSLHLKYVSCKQYIFYLFIYFWFN